MTAADRMGERIARTDLASKIHRLLLRLSGGRLGSEVRGIPVLLLTTRGRRARKRRTVPLMYFPDGDRLLLVASNAAQPDRPPAWWLNLQTNPAAWARTDTGNHSVHAEELGAAERKSLWPLMAKHNPNWARYQDETDRIFPIVSLQIGRRR